MTKFKAGKTYNFKHSGKEYRNVTIEKVMQKANGEWISFREGPIHRGILVKVITDIEEIKA